MAGGRVLQHVDALDVVRREVHERVQTGRFHKEGHAVDDVERCVVVRARLHVGIGRSHTADVDADGRPRLAAVLRGKYTLQHAASDEVLHVGRDGRHALDVLLLHGGDGAGQALAVLTAVADDHDVIECHVVITQDDVEGRLALEAYRLSLHADEGEHQFRPFVHFQRVFSVDVGDGSQGCPLDGDRDTRERFTMTVGDSSGEGPCSLLHRSCIHMTRWERASSCGQRRAATCTGQEGACEKFPVCHKCESIKVQFFRSIDKVKDKAYPYAVTVFANICISFKTIVRFCSDYRTFLSGFFCGEAERK